VPFAFRCAHKSVSDPDYQVTHSHLAQYGRVAATVTRHGHDVIFAELVEERRSQASDAGLHDRIEFGGPDTL
jgi:hypothetical protein